MARDVIVEGVTKGTGNQDAEVEERPETGQLFHDSQGRCGFCIDVTMLQEQKGFKVLGGETEFFQDLLRCFRLKRAEFESCMRVMVDREIDPGVAPIADPVEQDELFNSVPLMHGLPVSRSEQEHIADGV